MCPAAHLTSTPIGESCSILTSFPRRDPEAEGKCGSILSARQIPAAARCIWDPKARRGAQYHPLAPIWHGGVTPDFAPANNHCPACSNNKTRQGPSTPARSLSSCARSGWHGLELPSFISLPPSLFLSHSTSRSLTLCLSVRQPRQTNTGHGNSTTALRLLPATGLAASPIACLSHRPRL